MKVKSDPIPIRGSNQSTQTKHATFLVDEAMTIIESGRVKQGVDLLQRALDLLPDVGVGRQEPAAWEWFESHVRGGA